MGGEFKLYQQECVSAQPPNSAGHTVKVTIQRRPKPHHGAKPSRLNTVVLFFRMMLRAFTARSRSTGQVHPLKHEYLEANPTMLRHLCCDFTSRSIYWADGYVLVFSITDHNSYRTIQPLYQHVRRIHPSGNIPIILVSACLSSKLHHVHESAYCIFQFEAIFKCVKY